MNKQIYYALLASTLCVPQLTVSMINPPAAQTTMSTHSQPYLRNSLFYTSRYLLPICRWITNTVGTHIERNPFAYGDYGAALASGALAPSDYDPNRSWLWYFTRHVADS